MILIKRSTFQILILPIAPKKMEPVLSQDHGSQLLVQ
jgi:hypothetical protein